MNILYKQSPSEEDPGSAFLHSLGINQCYFKHLFSERDPANITKKRHHHTHYEIHMVESGNSSYEVSGITYKLNSGQFLLLPPRLPHRVTYRQPGTSTLSITFRISEPPGLFPDICSCVAGSLPPGVRKSIRHVLSEHAQKQYASSQFIAASLAQILILFWRISGVRKPSESVPSPGEDPRLTMAVQYIQDNIEFAPTVSEVAAYCHLSEKQISRLFASGKGMSATEYIRKLRVQQIERLLRDSSLSLRAISEKLHFSSEYYFNVFFTKYAGMNPGEFQKMHQKRSGGR